MPVTGIRQGSSPTPRAWTRRRAQLVDARKRQEFVDGNAKLAEAPIKHGELVEDQKGDKLIAEGGEDNDIYLLLTGSSPWS